MQNSLRLFIALEFSKEIHDQLSKLINELKKDGPTFVRWVKPENIHVTLKFLGETPQSKLFELQQTITSCCLSEKSFQLIIKGTGAFPSRKQPRVLWAGMNANEALDCLYLTIDHRLAALGFPKENRPFSPHLTLARINSISDPESLEVTMRKLFAAQNKDFGMVNVRRVTLFQSTLTAGGSIYTPLARFQLAE